MGRISNRALGICICVGMLSVAIVVGLLTQDFDDVLLAITPMVILSGAALLSRPRALELILVAVTVHFAFAAAGFDGKGPRYLDVAVTAGSVILGIVATQHRGWLLGRVRDIAADGAATIRNVAPMQLGIAGGGIALARDQAPATASMIDVEMPGVTQLRTRLGDTRISQRQQEVVQLVLQGLTARQIGTRLFISERTVETHLANVYERLGVHSRMELIYSLSQPVSA